MLNLSLNELKLIAKSRGIKGYKSKSDDRLWSTLNASKSVNESEKNFDDTKPTRNEDYDADDILKATMLDSTKLNKNIREIRKENYDEDKKLRDLRFFLDPKKDRYKPVKTVSAFNNNYIQYENIGDKGKNLSFKEYIDIIRPYLKDIINNHKTQGEWKIYSDNIIANY